MNFFSFLFVSRVFFSDLWDFIYFEHMCVFATLIGEICMQAKWSEKEREITLSDQAFNSPYLIKSDRQRRMKKSWLIDSGGEKTSSHYKLDFH